MAHAESLCFIVAFSLLNYCTVVWNSQSGDLDWDWYQSVRWFRLRQFRHVKVEGHTDWIKHCTMMDVDEMRQTRYPGKHGRMLVGRIFVLSVQSSSGKWLLEDSMYIYLHRILIINKRNLIMPEKWNSSAIKYAKYAIPRTTSGSTTVSTITHKHSQLKHFTN